MSKESLHCKSAGQRTEGCVVEHSSWVAGKVKRASDALWFEKSPFIQMRSSSNGAIERCEGP